MKKVLSKIKTFINNLTAKIGDKKMHFICSFIITFVIGLIFGIFPGILVGCLVGLAKEVYDEFRFRKDSEGVGFDKLDLVYDALGIISATVIILVL
jgi:hypothetical protein